MRILRTSRASPGPTGPGVTPARRGAALLLSLLILFVLIAIVYQISIAVRTTGQVAMHDVNLTKMDQAAESALLQVYDQLATDGESQDSASQAGGAAAAGGSAPVPPAAAGAAGAAAQPVQPTDSRRDEWGKPLRTEINEIKLRIFIQDEDSKINVLAMLVPDEKEAEAAFGRVVRCLDLCREGTSADIDARTAEDMAKAMLDHMKSRKFADQPRPALLSDDPQNEDLGLPLSLREFAVLPPFDESHFRDYRDEEGEIIHSIGAFLTVWSSVTTAADKPGAAAGTNIAGGRSAGGNAAGGKASAGKKGAAAGGGGSKAGSGGVQPAGTGAGGNGTGAAPPTTGETGNAPGNAPGGAAAGGATGAAGGAAAAQAGAAQPAESGGWAVNVNTAPPVVLKSLFDDRNVHPRLWDRVVEYRNLEEELEEGEEEPEPQLDEYGEEIIQRRIFDSLAELAEVEGFRDLEAGLQQQVNQLLTTQSHVFSVFVIARRSTAVEGEAPIELGSRPRRGDEDQTGDALMRVIRSVVWRHKVGDETAITPLVRWEVLDYVPYEVLDYPEEDR